MNQKALLKGLEKVEQIARAGKWRRLARNPFKYIFAIGFRHLLYPLEAKSKSLYTATFFGGEMKILLPASTDIYLTGGKSHDSEIRLARYLILKLQTGDTFIDIGAHYGYFTLLAAKCISEQGRLFAFEPASQTFNILKENVRTHANIKAFNYALSNVNGTLEFFEYPNLYSEFNSLKKDQHQDGTWINKGVKRSVKAIRLEEILEEKQLFPKLIKIDVEGAEAEVIEGMLSHLKVANPELIIEFPSSERANDSHKEIIAQLAQYDYAPFEIDSDGGALAIEDIAVFDQTLTAKGLESDNLVLKKLNN